MRPSWVGSSLNWNGDEELVNVPNQTSDHTITVVPGKRQENCLTPTPIECFSPSAVTVDVEDGRPAAVLGQQAAGDHGGEGAHRHARKGHGRHLGPLQRRRPVRQQLKHGRKNDALTARRRTQKQKAKQQMCHQRRSTRVSQSRGNTCRTPWTARVATRNQRPCLAAHGIKSVSRPVKKFERP